uniref:Transposase n=2 Tax=Candidatus Kentrum sp. FW TaxID=2126338 RepID=A0A450T1P5_9GAMM|nr:MAG: hypothetical protein BECKFW1821A_GA0114235_11027 [Candidatus Kentron sp. FW]
MGTRKSRRLLFRRLVRCLEDLRQNDQKKFNYGLLKINYGLLKKICGRVFQINRHNALNMVVKIPEIRVYFLRIKNYRLL